MVLLTAEVVLVLGPPTYPTRKLLLEDTDRVEGFRHLRVIAQEPLTTWSLSKDY